ncbi:hypothetical protein ROZALSC1DRAFT_23489 [Rozella allomycis CSF55]|uniref:Uncharacterized protein n=1 Tax=Rozella allomycis (strain CSF55) TaxID=988480 RepID=A0A4P9YIN2_ROZAC|nr:hypothetical protein ROZALSC1DRAFT_23489 [Rozella allomycis CSF55]
MLSYLDFNVFMIIEKTVISKIPKCIRSINVAISNNCKLQSIEPKSRILSNKYEDIKITPTAIVNARKRKVDPFIYTVASRTSDTIDKRTTPVIQQSYDESVTDQLLKIETNEGHRKIDQITILVDNFKKRERERMKLRRHAKSNDQVYLDKERRNKIEGQEYVEKERLRKRIARADKLRSDDFKETDTNRVKLHSETKSKDQDYLEQKRQRKRVLRAADKLMSEDVKKTEKNRVKLHRETKSKDQDYLVLVFITVTYLATA